MSQYEFPFADWQAPQPWRPRRPEFLFFAALPAVDAIAAALRIGHEASCDYGLTKPLHAGARLHVTLSGVSRRERLLSKDIFAARNVADAISMPTFEVTFDRIASFKSKAKGGRGNPLVLLGGDPALDELSRRLVAGLQTQGFRVNTGQLHVTLCYDRKIIPEQPVPPVRWTVREFVLIHSERGLSRYNFIDRWSLVDRQS